jgi:hypothetical protein
VACAVFFLSASLVLFQDENYWLAALVAGPPTASILAFWCVQGQKARSVGLFSLPAADAKRVADFPAHGPSKELPFL